MLHERILAAVKSGLQIVALSKGIPKEDPKRVEDPIIPIDLEDVEEVWRNTLPASKAEEVIYYSPHKLTTKRSKDIPHEGERIVPSRDFAIPTFPQAQGESPDVTEEVLHTAITNALAAMAPRVEPTINPFYASANGCAVVVRDADRKSQKLEWICKGLAVPTEGSPLYESQSYVACDIISIPRGMAVPSLLAKDQPADVSGYLIFTVAGVAQWRVSPSVGSKGSKAATVFTSGPKSLCYITGSASVEHVGDIDNACVLCIFKCYKAPATCSPSSSTTHQSKKATPINGSTSVRDEAGVKERSISRGLQVRESVLPVQLPVSLDTRLRWNTEFASIIDFREWRSAAKIKFEATKEGTSAFNDVQWSRCLAAFEAANGSCLASWLTHLMACRRADGTILQFRCSFELGQAAALIKSRAPSTVSVSDLVYDTDSRGTSGHLCQSMAVALSIIGLVVRVRG